MGYGIICIKKKNFSYTSNDRPNIYMYIKIILIHTILCHTITINKTKLYY
jgi:hypothetical protein